uniref:C2H2-type domain-containing protein n=1 Tax=Rhizophagus irregularis (strain DAOM 181602 / DAOM 197198 / MUCL 43194) TaxID=747089 RepID=U9U9H8_RHIID
MATPINLFDIQSMRYKHSVPIEKSNSLPSPSTIHSVDPLSEIPANASAQKSAANAIQMAEKQIYEYEQIYNITNDAQIRDDMYKKIESLQDKKKLKQLIEKKEVVRYDKPGRPSLLFKNPDLHDRIHDCVEFGSADAERRKEAIKVRTIENLRKNLEERYEIYMARTTLKSYLLPHQSNSLAAKAHHHPAWVAVARVSRTETNEHPDTHYCLASVKCAKQFTSTFADVSVVISQDDKAKIGLGVPAVGHTFHKLQSVNEPATIADHDFPIGFGQKLIPSVYLIINPNESNDELRTGKLAIFIRPQWSLGTSSLTHMQDLESLASNSQYDDALKTNGMIRPIWILLVDGGPDENPRHLKNIKTYCQLFRKFDLDFLSIRTHAPGQSKYNPVERGMATLSGKLAGITLPIDHFGKHLDSQGKVINPELAARNFRYSGEALCEIWRRDLIFGKKVDACYVDMHTNPFEHIQFEGTEKEMVEKSKRRKKEQQKKLKEQDKETHGNSECFVPWSWIENHCNLCTYSLDIKRCTNRSCCGPPKAKEAMDFLHLHNGFLPPVTKAKDGRFINPIHLLQYGDLLKIPGYDAHCESMEKNTYLRLCCPVCQKYFPTLAFLVNHKRLIPINNDPMIVLMHPTTRGRPKKQQSSAFDDLSLLPSQRKRSYSEMELEPWVVISDRE